MPFLPGGLEGGKLFSRGVVALPVRQRQARRLSPAATVLRIRPTGLEALDLVVDLPVHRWLGKYDEAFAAYGKALALDPRHKGALEYSGIAYLKTNQKAQAEAQLAKLQAICATCEETSDLAKAVAAAK